MHTHLEILRTDPNFGSSLAAPNSFEPDDRFRELRWRRVVLGLALTGSLLALVSGCTDGKSVGSSEMSAVQVVVVEARRQSVTESLSLVGSFAANEIVEIKAETEGIIREILFEEGQPVKKGQIMVRLDDSKLKSSLDETEANFRLSKATFERSQQLFKDNLISQQEFDQAASAYSLFQATVELRKRQWQDAEIVAPFEGTAGAREISPGQVITRNTTLAWLVDLDPVKVEFNVPERFLSQVQVGQSIEVTVAAYPGRKFKGTVYFVSPYVDETMRTSLIKAKISNESGELKPGMFANLDLTLTVRNDAVVVPEAAISQMMEGDRANLFVVVADSTVQLRPVKLGVFMRGQVEIMSGLNGGEKVVVEGVQKIGPGSKVKLAPPEAAMPYQRLEKDVRVEKVTG